MNKYYQAYNISKYTRFKDMWLYLPEGNIKEYRNNYDKSYTGWYYGAGNIDRVCAKGSCCLSKISLTVLVEKLDFLPLFLL